MHRLRQFLRTLSVVPPRPAVSQSYLEKDLATCSYVFLRCDCIRRLVKPPFYDDPFSRGKKTFRILRRTREEVVSVDRPKAAVLNIPPDEPCGPISPAPRPSIHLSHLLPLLPSSQPSTVAISSSTSNIPDTSHSYPAPPAYINRS
ncbi:unnamed protein product [Dibothriocephalus latus]|uniref:Uncharacterized protein n=1 Tax=Dibothriocephalus latus TaxID=60516 RepID=A0A3P7LZF8_DIBLA|nr:unnamed protein product [Dibothriocephalus latus]